MTVQTGLPRRRTCPFDPPVELGELRRSTPVSRMTYPDGHEGWLVTGHAETRAVLADRRFSSRAELLRTPVPMNRPQPFPPADPGMFTAMDDPEHAHYRKLLTGAFTVRRMRLLEARVAEITEHYLDELAATGPPADLVPDFALPIPSMVICEMLGVPVEERTWFQRRSAQLFDLDLPADDRTVAMAETSAFLVELTRAKRTAGGTADGAGDLLQDLLAGGQLTDEELGNIALTLLVAGHETTGNMLSLGTFRLLTAPEQLALLRADPALANNAIEELLRYLTVLHLGPVRVALANVEIGGEVIHTGEAVTLSLPAANRDPLRFNDPDQLDLRRTATGHVAFGHGVHQCLGQQLARVELRTALPALFSRFPGLRLAVPADEVVTNADAGIYGVRELPATWDEVSRVSRVAG